MTQEFADLFLRTNDSQWEKAQSYVQLHHPMIWFSSSTELKMRIGHRREFVSRSFDWAVFKAYRSCNTPNWWCTTIFLDFFPTPPPLPGLTQLRHHSISCISSLVSSFFEVWGKGTIYWLSHKESHSICFTVKPQALGLLSDLNLTA